MDTNPSVILYTEWKPINNVIKLNDICILATHEQEFFCSYIVPYKQFEYLYFGSFDFKNFVFAVQSEINGQNYIRVLNKKPEKIFALRLFKKARQNES